MPYMQNIVVTATFLDFQANIFPFLFKPRNGNFHVYSTRSLVALPLVLTHARLLYMDSHCRLSYNCWREPVLDIMTLPQVCWNQPKKNMNYYEIRILRIWPIQNVFVASLCCSLFPKHLFHFPFLFICLKNCFPRLLL